MNSIQHLSLFSSGNDDNNDDNNDDDDEKVNANAKNAKNDNDYV